MEKNNRYFIFEGNPYTISGSFIDFLQEKSGGAPQTADAELPGIILYSGAAFVSLISAAYVISGKKKV